MSGSINSVDLERRLREILARNAAEITDPSMLLPASDYFDLAGEEFGRRLLLTIGADGRDYCLRPDFTLPIAQSFIQQARTEAATYAYFGRVMRQRSSGPAEFTQLGLELIGHNNSDGALETVLQFVTDIANASNAQNLTFKFGSVAMFETLLAQSKIPDVWMPRLRHRFGNSDALAALLNRLDDPERQSGGQIADHAQLVEHITQQMIKDGLSLTEGRTPSEIASRMIEKQTRDAAFVPQEALELVRQFLALNGDLREVVARAFDLCKAADIDVSAQRDHLLSTADLLSNIAPDISVTFDASFSPRLHYYTGLVFELTSMTGTILGSGGEYDRLMEALGANREVSATGAAIWFERLVSEAN